MRSVILVILSFFLAGQALAVQPNVPQKTEAYSKAILEEIEYPIFAVEPANVMKRDPQKLLFKNIIMSHLTRKGLEVLCQETMDLPFPQELADKDREMAGMATAVRPDVRIVYEVRQSKNEQGQLRCEILISAYDPNTARNLGASLDTGPWITNRKPDEMYSVCVEAAQESIKTVVDSVIAVLRADSRNGRLSRIILQDPPKDAEVTIPRELKKTCASVNIFRIKGSPPRSITFHAQCKSGVDELAALLEKTFATIFPKQEYGFLAKGKRSLAIQFK